MAEPSPALSASLSPCTCSCSCLSLDSGQNFLPRSHDLGPPWSFLFYLMSQDASLETLAECLFPLLCHVMLPTFLFSINYIERKGRNNFKTYKVPPNIYPWTCKQTTFLSSNATCSVSSVFCHFCSALGNLWACDQGTGLRTRLTRRTVLVGQRADREACRTGNGRLLPPCYG